MKTRQEICRDYYQQTKTLKRCPACESELPLTAFPKAFSRPLGRAAHCKACRKARYQDTPAMRKVRHIRHRYGLEIHEYVGLYEKQGRGCAICRTPISLDGTAHVDHCHNSGLVRGLLCRGCNTGIGHFKDSAALLMEAAEYVKRKS